MPLVERRLARKMRESLVPLEPAGTARQTYRAMLDQHIVPQMREWGFIGDGETYEYPSEVWHLRLAFVPASWNTVTRFQFDVNVVAVTRVAWDQWRVQEPSLPESPDPAVYYAHDFESGGGLMSRLGEFHRRSTDTRWTVYGDEDPSAVSADVLARIQRQVMSEFAGRAEARPVIA